ncbi:MAG TPA: lytic transglycosylase domain-containing protein, partial [Gemmatimonadaceae bacterium]|nr:lytic transglycosylase domain-containing protein [Gemmatimonadaceae bacterium]
RELAHERWRELTRRDELSYYGVLAARRLGTTPWRPAAAADSLPVPTDMREALARAATLEELGMVLEERLEYDELARLAGSDPARLLATAAALQARELSSRGIRLAARARDRGAAEDARLLRRLYPVVHGDVLAAESRERGLDPALVAGLIRQESNFEPRATSPAGARGLMQIMPRVGTAIARGMSFPVWDTALLWEPDVNLRLGAAHLATLVREYDRLEHVLAAYNAGESRVRRWRERRGADDPELFTERIPYPETRDYVRLVLRNRDLYRALYGWRAPDGAQQSGR